MNYSDLKKSYNTLIKTAPITVSDISGLDESQKYYMDMNNVDVNDLSDLPPPDDFEEFKPIVYGRVTTDPDNFTELQYYLFYPFQNWYSMNHEGDWGFVQVTLNRLNRVHSVLYSFNLFEEIYYDTHELEFVNDTHPVVLIGKGSHNNYGTDKPYLFPIDIPEELSFWANLFWGFKSLDKLSKEGIVLAPSALSLEENEYAYQIDEINSSTPWIDYKGLWGQRSPFPLRSGPKGPKYSLQFQDWWSVPHALVTIPEIPFLGVQLFSPLDIEILNGSGSAINDTSENIIFYTGSDEEPETIMVTGGKNYTINLIANDNGNFTLDIYYYNNSSGIMLRYKNISNSENTRALVAVSDDSFYILWLDYEGDGSYEQYYLPDENITYNRTYYLPDTDNDSVSDFEDNCIEIPNPEQSDFNQDGKGDMCDNPKYYKNQALLKLETVDADKKFALMMKNFVEKRIEKSLSAKYWEDDFTPKNSMVFLYELLAVNNLGKYQEVSMLLSKADSLIIEKQINELSELDKAPREEITYKLAIYLFDMAKSYEARGFYHKSVLYYYRAWVLLNKIGHRHFH